MPMVATKESLNLSCPACSHPDLTLVEEFPMQDFFHRFALEHDANINQEPQSIRSINNAYPASFFIYQCNNCRLQFPTPRIAGSPDFYSFLYRYMSPTMMRWEFEKFKQDAVPGNRLLDIGCGDGFFLRYARDLGYDAYGTDFNTERAGHSDAKVSVLDVSELSSFFQHQAPFDVYTLWHVLEHVDEPKNVFQALAQHSHKDSKIVIAVPSDKFINTLITIRPITDYPPHHLSRWTPQSLSAIGQQTGWEMVNHCYEPTNNPIKFCALRIAKYISRHGGLLKELSSYASRGKFSLDALQPRYDAAPTTFSIRCVAAIVYLLLAVNKNKYSGLSQYCTLRRRESGVLTSPV